jgi:hypothetical protein
LANRIPAARSDTSGLPPNEAFGKGAAVPALPCRTDRASVLPLDCRQAITETAAAHDLHFIEFDDQGWTYPEAASAGVQRVESRSRVACGNGRGEAARIC